MKFSTLAIALAVGAAVGCASLGEAATRKHRGKTKAHRGNNKKGRQQQGQKGKQQQQQQQQQHQQGTQHDTGSSRPVTVGQKPTNADDAKAYYNQLMTEAKKLDFMSATTTSSAASAGADSHTAAIDDFLRAYTSAGSESSGLRNLQSGSSWKPAKW